MEEVGEVTPASQQGSIVEVLPAAPDVDEDEAVVEIEILNEEEETEESLKSNGANTVEAENERVDVQLLQEELVQTVNALKEMTDRATSCELLYQNTDFLGCMRLLLPNITLPGVNVSHFINMLRRDRSLGQEMEIRWKEFYRYLEQGTESLHLPEQVVQAFEGLERKIRSKWEEFAKYAQASSAAEDSSSSHADKAQQEENEKYQNVVNKSKQLSDKIQSTWHKVKNLSSDILKSNKEAVKNVKEKLADNVSRLKETVSGKLADKMGNIGEKVKKGWRQVQDHVKENAGWLYRKKKEEEHQRYQDHPQDHHGNSPFAQDREEDREDFAKTDAREFEEKASGKKQTATLKERYEEFWKRTNYDPDDYVAEDFFQGNQREWKKQQKRVKKMHGRIHRLNEDKLYSMDDDDIEDIYEDLDELEEDLDHVEEQPERLKNWLTCQSRWWKSRVQRKNGGGHMTTCGAQLMHWQLRALCRPLCRGKKCRKHAPHNVEACQMLYEKTITKKESWGENVETEEVRSVHEFDAAMGLNDSSVVQELNMDSPSSIERPDDSNNDDMVPSPPASSPPHMFQPEGDAASAKDPSWLFDRDLEREYRRSNKPGWQFKRANRREFEREKPWYYKRADSREKERGAQKRSWN